MIDISEHIDEVEVREQLDELDVNSELEDWSSGDRIHVNGDIYGIHKNGKNLVRHSNQLDAVVPFLQKFRFATTKRTRISSSIQTRGVFYGHL
jgi:hypothetical protein